MKSDEVQYVVLVLGRQFLFYCDELNVEAPRRSCRCSSCHAARASETVEPSWFYVACCLTPLRTELTSEQRFAVRLQREDARRKMFELSKQNAVDGKTIGKVCMKKLKRSVDFDDYVVTGGRDP